MLIHFPLLQFDNNYHIANAVRSQCLKSQFKGIVRFHCLIPIVYAPRTQSKVP